METSPVSFVLVTAFFELPERRTDRDISTYLFLFERLAQVGLPIVVFFDEALVAERERLSPYPNVTVVPCRPEDSWTYKTLAEWPHLSLPSEANPMKDTRFFLTITNAKLDYLALAQQIFPARHLGWIDFGIFHIVPEATQQAFAASLRGLRPPERCLYAPGCWGQPTDLEDLWLRISWRFCGGFLLGDAASLAQMYALYQKVLSAEVRERKALTWEVNVWALLEAKYGQRFDWYPADHNETIVNVPSTGRSMRICLNMIVRNESAIIERCLDSVAPVIDEWVICDTGSTDGTPQKIEGFFAARGIPGQIVYTTFKDFAQARNDSLEAARQIGSAEYVLLTDADMELRGTIDKTSLTAASYRLIQRDTERSYYNTRLVMRALPARYVGVTHEYLSVPGVASEPLLSAWFWDNASGANRPNKAERDVRLLRAGLEVEPQNGRYMFYLANTYRDMGQHDEAIKWYKARIAAGGWDEEVWYSYYSIALCHRDSNADAEFVAAVLEAYNVRPTRAEPLYHLAKFYRVKGKNEAAADICEVGRTIQRPADQLFLEDVVYEHGFDEEMAIVGYYSYDNARREAGYEACARLTAHPCDGTRDLARRNFVWYVKMASQLFGAQIEDLGPLIPDSDFAPTNPSIWCGPEGRFGIVRTVNYTVTSQGQYPTSDGSGIIKTRNLAVRFDENWRVVQTWLINDATAITKTDFPVEGFEDCRLYRWRDKWRCSATVRDRGDGRCEMALITFDDDWRAVDMRIVRDLEHERHQKNWMPFVDESADMMRFVYMVDPTTSIDVAGDETRVIFRGDVLKRNLTALRGGSQAIPVAWHGRWGRLLLAHEVVWTPERVYMHRFVLLDDEHKVAAVSDPFYFKHRNIEFAAGLARDGKRLVASFGVQDASAHLAFVDEKSVLAHLLDRTV